MTDDEGRLVVVVVVVDHEVLAEYHLQEVEAISQILPPLHNLAEEGHTNEHPVEVDRTSEHREDIAAPKPVMDDADDRVVVAIVAVDMPVEVNPAQETNPLPNIQEDTQAEVSNDMETLHHHLEIAVVVTKVVQSDHQAVVTKVVQSDHQAVDIEEIVPKDHQVVVIKVVPKDHQVVVIKEQTNDPVLEKEANQVDQYTKKSLSTERDFFVEVD